VPEWEVGVPPKWLAVQGLQCPNCLEVIYSRNRHDYHSCQCGEISVDGGFDYLRSSWLVKTPIRVLVKAKGTMEELHQSYVDGDRKFGWIAASNAEKHILKYLKDLD
jgi:hypothetical protein